MTTNTDLRSRIDAMIAEIDRIQVAYVERMGYTHVAPSKASAEYLSGKWCRIMLGRSAYAFVALSDFETKGLGKVKAGDIHMPHGYKSPAKHARGSVFTPDFGRCLGPHGVAYLR